MLNLTKFVLPFAVKDARVFKFVCEIKTFINTGRLLKMIKYYYQSTNEVQIAVTEIKLLSSGIKLLFIPEGVDR